MSSALDQSLDEIIASKPKNSGARKPRAPKAKVTKAVQQPKKATSKAAKAAKGATPVAPDVLFASYATKVVVYGLPKDIKQDAIKDFFSSEIGGVQSVVLSYNEKGHSKGIATVNFKSSVNANKAVEKYNGAPIDGKNKLKLELIIDPTKKPLASRIVANVTAVSDKKKKQSKETPKKATSNTTDAPKKKAKKARAKKPAKKTVEQLDQEMSDYFEKKD